MQAFVCYIVWCINRQRPPETRPKLVPYILAQVGGHSLALAPPGGDDGNGPEWILYQLPRRQRMWQVFFEQSLYVSGKTYTLLSSHRKPLFSRWLRYPQMAPNQHMELLITWESCFTSAGGRLSVLPGLLQIALDGSRSHHAVPVYPRWPRYLQMAADGSRSMSPDDHMELLSREAWWRNKVRAMED